MTVKPKFPKTLGGCIDNLFLMRAERLKAAKAVEDMKSQEALLEGHIIHSFARVLQCLAAKRRIRAAHGICAWITLDTRLSIAVYSH